MKTKFYSVAELARAANVTERTLRYYDEIGLLKPRTRKENGERVYGRDEELRLQQILLYKQLEYSLVQIKEVLDNPGFDLLESLKTQRNAFKLQQSKAEQIVAIIDKTILNMQDKTRPLSNAELYQGISQKTIDEYRAEAEEKWGDEFRSAEKRLKAMSKDDIRKLKAEGDAIVTKLSQLTRLNPTDAIAQKAVAEYHDHLNQWNPTSKERFRALADMYVNDERFRDYYEKRAKGLSTWLREAIIAFTQ